MTSQNLVALTARLSSKDALRYTPAGIAILNFVLTHQSSQHEAGIERLIECEVLAMAVGPVAEKLSRQTLQTELNCRGFLARKYRSGHQLELHVTEFTEKGKI